MNDRFESLIKELDNKITLGKISFTTRYYHQKTIAKCDSLYANAKVEVGKVLVNGAYVDEKYKNCKTGWVVMVFTLEDYSVCRCGNEWYYRVPIGQRENNIFSEMLSQQQSSQLNQLADRIEGEIRVINTLKLLKSRDGLKSLKLLWGYFTKNGYGVDPEEVYNLYTLNKVHNE